MTRVNLVPVGELADQHLFAEFRELKMVPKSLARSLRALHRGEDANPASVWAHNRRVTKLLGRIPREYVLGAGHVSFFYDKGLFLQKRYSLIRHELRRRGVNFDENSLLDPDRVFERDARFRNDYTPTPAALALIRARIAERIAQKPEWYRWTAPTGLVPA